MDFAFTTEQQMLVESLSSFLRREAPPELQRQIDADRTFPHDLWKRLAAGGWLRVGIPEAYGGSGGSVTDQTIVAETLARGAPLLAHLAVACVSFGAKAFGEYGTEAQKKSILEPMMAGETFVAMGFTEPSGGSDALSLSTKAESVDGGWLINGRKVFTTLADRSENILIVSRVGPKSKKRTEGITLLVVEHGQPGLEIRPIPVLGYWGSGTTEVTLTDVWVPDSARLGDVGGGWKLLTQTLNAERVLAAANGVGIAQAVLAEAKAYALDRMAFGRPIAGFQTIQGYLVEMENLIECARLVMYRAAWLIDEGRDPAAEATRAKLLGGEAAVRCAQLGMRILGGYGYSMEFDMQRHFREAQLLVTGVITSEMATNFLAERMGLPRSY